MDHGSGWLTVLAAPVLGVLGTVAGAAAVYAGNLRVEGRRHRREARSVAVALAASIQSALWIVDRRGHVLFFQEMLEAARAGRIKPFSGVVDEERLADPISERLLDRFGLLPADMAWRVTRFLTVFYAIRVDIVNLRSGNFSSIPEAVVNLLEEDIALWTEVSKDAERLVVELRGWAAEDA